MGIRADPHFVASAPAVPLPQTGLGWWKGGALLDSWSTSHLEKGILILKILVPLFLIRHAPFWDHLSGHG